MDKEVPKRLIELETKTNKTFKKVTACLILLTIIDLLFIAMIIVERFF